jgi:hypothetical protein
VACAALVLALSACASAQRATAPSAHRVSPMVAAERDPQTLLRRISVPAVAEPAPQLATGLLAGSIGSLSVGAYRVWRIALPYRTVLRFFERQHPRAAVANSNLLVGLVHVFGRNRELSWSFRPIRPFISSRMLSVTVLALSSNATGIRVEADDVWRVRPASERLPAGARTITIRRARWENLAPFSGRITEPSKVTQVVRRFDALPLFAGAYGYCPASAVGPPTVITFHSATGRVLAEASVFGSGAGGPCGTGIGVTVRGRPEPMLAGNFLERVLALAGVPSRAGV